MGSIYRLRFGKYRVINPFEFMRSIGNVCGSGILKPIGNSVFEITTENPIPNEYVEKYRTFGMIIEDHKPLQDRDLYYKE